MKVAWIVAALLISIPSWAIELVPKWAMEKQFLAREDHGSERLFGAELDLHISKAMRIRPEVGAWFARTEGRSSSFYAAVQWGYQARTPIGLFVDAYIGPAFIAKTDTRLGSHFQIKHDMGFGWSDDEGYGVGVFYCHFSDAGISGEANYGRDFGGARFLIPLGI
jgi:hypothetical protein